MALGARLGDDPQLLLYRSDDLLHWDFLGCALQGQRELDGYMWECPDIFELEGRDVLLYSPQGLKPCGYDNWNLYQNSYRMGQLDDKGVFKPGGPLHELDHGHDFYAAQTLLAPDGRRLLWAWMDMWESPMPSQSEHWCGALTLPREVSRDGDRLLMRPARELIALRQAGQVLQIGALKSANQLLDTWGRCWRLNLSWILPPAALNILVWHCAAAMISRSVPCCILMPWPGAWCSTGNIPAPG